MSVDENRACPDCDGSMKAIKMIDQQLVVHSEMVYAVAEAKRSTWSSKYPVEGTIQACMCDSCGLIKLHGQPAP